MAAFRARAGVRASLTVPLIKSGRLRAFFYVGDHRPRRWSESDVQLTMAVAERTWASIERARAEAQLRSAVQELETLTDALPVLISLVGADGRYRFVNKAYEAWFGRPRTEVVGATLEEVLGPEAYAAVRSRVERALAGEAFSFESRLAYRHGGPRWVQVDYVPKRSETGAVEGYYALVQDVSARHAAEAALRESEERLRLAAQAARIGTWDLELASGRGRWDAAATEIIGVEAAEYDSHSWSFAIHPDDRARVIRAFEAALAPNGPDYEIECRGAEPGPDGRDRWISSHGAVIRDAQGAAVRAIGILRDITERKRADLHRELLISELNHRVKNTLALVQSLAHQTFRAEDDPAQSIRAFEGRLLALAAAHDVLTRENWETAELGDVVRQTIRAHDPDRFAIAGPAIRLAPKVALAIAMVIHELCTNAAKYGALSSDAGRVDVTWEESLDRKSFTLSWRERDGPIVSPPRRRGFGSRLLERALPYELGGVVSVTYAPTGVVCDLQVVTGV